MRVDGDAQDAAVAGPHPSRSSRPHERQGGSAGGGQEADHTGWSARTTERDSIGAGDERRDQSRAAAFDQGDQRDREGARVDERARPHFDPGDHERDRQHAEDGAGHQGAQPRIDAPVRVEPPPSVGVEDEAQHHDARGFDDVMDVHGEPEDERAQNVHVSLLIGWVRLPSVCRRGAVGGSRMSAGFPDRNRAGSRNCS
jgi:hypothetical protein